MDSIRENFSLWSRVKRECTIYILHYNINSISQTQNPMFWILGGEWRTECLNTRFLLSILLCIGYNVKLNSFQLILNIDDFKIFFIKAGRLLGTILIEKRKKEKTKRVTTLLLSMENKNSGWILICDTNTIRKSR